MPVVKLASVVISLSNAEILRLVSVACAAKAKLLASMTANLALIVYLNALLAVSHRFFPLDHVTISAAVLSFAV